MVWILQLILILISVETKENAVIVILCRNEEINEIDKSIKNLEDKFNNKYKYPYVFLNDKEFTEEFKTKLSKTTNNTAKFGLVEPKDWDMPQTIDRQKAKTAWDEMARSGVPYANKESYHNMCRYFSRGFYKHPLLSSYEYYWRVEPGVQFRCDIEDDPFEYLRKTQKKYGFVITIKEFMNSIPTLGLQMTNYIRKRLPEFIKRQKNINDFIFSHGEYNGCHFWSNFEIASFKFLRSKEYNEFVDQLEESGGFYYERWGDAPVHSIAAVMLLDKSEIHFFENIGYTHPPFTHCPSNGKNCDCKPSESIDFSPLSCLKKYQEKQPAEYL
ncbi:alpha 1,2-mannosyltransferase [Pancytospora epiphaga]|nr:alpha 1,2-mannosyltransferase [Pancytospora epiphaga]